MSAYSALYLSTYLMHKCLAHLDNIYIAVKRFFLFFLFFNFLMFYGRVLQSLRIEALNGFFMDANADLTRV